MVKKMLVVALIASCIQISQAAGNLYEQHYKEQNNRSLKSMAAQPDTKMYVSNHADVDNISMLEKGYDLMGSSGFESGSITPDMALDHAKVIKADVVLVYSKYASNRSVQSTMQAIKEAAGTTGEIDPEVLEQGGEQYKYYASYWAKLPMPLLGVHVIKLKRQQQESDDLAVEDGLKILAVIKESPAYKAGLLRGDVLLKIGEIHLQVAEQLSEAARKYKGKAVEVVYTRNQLTSTTSATLNGH